MSMDNLKLISVRVSPESLKRIDDYVSHRRWLTRSNVVNTAVEIIAIAIERGLFPDMHSYNPRFDDIKEFTFKTERKHL